MVYPFGQGALHADGSHLRTECFQHGNVLLPIAEVIDGDGNVRIVKNLDQVIADKLNVMDATAIVMCRDNHLPLRVFDLTRANALVQAMAGDELGTLVAA